MRIKTQLALQADKTVRCPVSDCRQAQSLLSIATYKSFPSPLTPETKTLPENPSVILCTVCSNSAEPVGDFIGTEWTVTECGHLVCKPCITLWTENRINNNEPVNCPYCKKIQGPQLASYFISLSETNTSQEEGASITAEVSTQTASMPSSSSQVTEEPRSWSAALQPVIATLRTISTTYNVGQILYRYSGFYGLAGAAMFYAGRYLYKRSSEETDTTSRLSGTTRFST